MNCDQAFDCLTDRQKRDSGDLLEHLSECPRCRDMAELLEPAVDLLADVADSNFEVDPYEPGRPGDNSYRDSIDSEASQPKRATSSRVERLSSRIASRPWMKQPGMKASRHRDSLRIAAFLMCIAVLSAAMVNVGRDDESNALAISLPADCQRSTPTEAGPDSVVAGCVACHLRMESLAGLPTVRKEHAQQLVQTCVQCHLDMTASDRHVAELDSGVHGASGEQSPLQMASCLFRRSEG